MAHDSASQTPIAASPEEELAALVTQVATLSKLAVDLSEQCIDADDKALSKLALEVTRHCIDINDKIPRVVQVQVDAAVAVFRKTPAFYENIAPTPDEMEVEYPPGRGDKQVWYVVCVGRQPGFYTTYEEAEDEVDGVPRGHRRRVPGRIAALAYYRQMYEQGKEPEPELPDELSQNFSMFV
ncbi:hypothetical protein B0H14DRAFT_3498762 [Mycena olivaceomarginata]|nr:hypothetical protein B0H14DRAFT_3498762 [Mycena olivaceomarginata]